MKYVALGIAVLFLMSVVVYVQIGMEEEDQHEVNEFIKSHGATKVPSSWRNEVGRGI